MTKAEFKHLVESWASYDDEYGSLSLDEIKKRQTKIADGVTEFDPQLAGELRKWQQSYNDYHEATDSMVAFCQSKLER